MDNLELHVFRVGHGLCTLVHGVVNGMPYNAVFDCGFMSICSSEKYNGYNLSSGINNSLNMMRDIIINNGDHLDLLVSSHQDEDHNSLLLRLIAKLNFWDERCLRDPWIKISDNQYVSLFEDAVKNLTECIDSYKYRYHSNDMIERVIDGTMLKNCENSYNIKITYKFIANNKFNLSRWRGINFRFEIKLKTNMSFLSKTKYNFSGTRLKILISNTATLIFRKKEAFLNLFIDEEMYLNKLKIAISTLVVESNIKKVLMDTFKITFDDAKQIEEVLLEVLNQEIGNLMPKRNFIIYPYKIIDIINKGKWNPRPVFYINQVVLGGDSDREYYNNLYNFFENYDLYYSEEHDRIRIARNWSYTYYDFTSDGGLKLKEKNNAGASVANLDTLLSENFNLQKKATLYNETSTVVNFIYNTGFGKRSILFPGDVTPHHHIDIGDNIQSCGAQCSVVFLPHHGSANTNILYTYDENDEPVESNLQPLENMYNKIRQSLGTHNIVSIIGECLTNDKHYLPRKECIDKIINFSQAPRVPNMYLNCYSLNDDRKTYSHVDYSNYQNLSVYTTGYSDISTDMGLVFDLNVDTIIPQPFNRLQKNKTMPTLPRPRVLPPDNLFI